ncbi:MAG TPA: hypothetical protein PKE57_07880, partial [Cellvibrionaceae bacterium]|nr:hypothetical protein [Cellvibrionaceae bacterium]
MNFPASALPPLAALTLSLAAAPALAELDWQARANLSHSQQAYDEQPSQAQTQLLLSSLWRDDNWDLTFSLPLISMDANYQIEPGRTPNLCARIQAAKPQKLARWLRLGRVNQKTIDRCLAQANTAEDETVSGLGDARLEANYYWQPSDNLELSLGSGVKAANAEPSKNLGSGRESLYLMGGLTYLWSSVSAGVSGEYSQHLGEGGPDEQDSNQSLSAHLDWQWQPSLSLGAFTRWESASFQDEDDLVSSGVAFTYQPIKNLSLGLSIERFQPNSQGLSRSLTGH